jgi:hypothetical protein
VHYTLFLITLQMMSKLPMTCTQTLLWRSTCRFIICAIARLDFPARVIFQSQQPFSGKILGRCKERRNIPRVARVISVAHLCCVPMIEHLELPQWWTQHELFMPHLRSLNEWWNGIYGANPELIRANSAIAKYLWHRGQYNQAEVGDT